MSRGLVQTVDEFSLCQRMRRANGAGDGQVAGFEVPGIFRRGGDVGSSAEGSRGPAIPRGWLKPLSRFGCIRQRIITGLNLSAFAAQPIEDAMRVRIIRRRVAAKGVADQRVKR